MNFYPDSIFNPDSIFGAAEQRNPPPPEINQNISHKEQKTMLKKTYHVILAGALALAQTSAAVAEYEQICLRVGTAGHVSTFLWAMAERDNRNGLDPHISRRNERDGEGVGRIHAHERRCFNLADIGAQPGDRLRFYVQAHGGKTVMCAPKMEHDHIHEGFFLNPDGPRSGVLTFHSSGTTLNHGCRLESGDLRMHSACNATLDGMINAGCAPWRPTIAPRVLHEIVKRDQGVGVLGSAMRRGADVNEAEDGFGTVPLHYAAQFNRAEYAEALTEAGANLNARGRGGETPILTAVIANPDDPAALRAMVRANPEAARVAVNSAMDNGDFPLHLAAAQGRLDMVEILLESGARINALHSGNGESALEAAKRTRQTEVTDRLRELGAREEVYDGIIYDVVAEDRGISRLRDALNRGGNPNAADSEGKTALHLAAERNSIEYAKILLDHPAIEKDLRDEDGRTPLMSAVERNHPVPSVFRKLISKGADVNLTRDDGNFPLYAAVGIGRLDMVRQLGFVRGINLNARHPDTNLTAGELAESLYRANRGADMRKIRNFLTN